MVNLAFVYLSLIFLLALAGALRGWAKEILVTFGIILAIFLISLFEQFVPILRDYMNAPGKGYFIFRLIIVLLVLFIAYQTPSFSRLQRGGDRFRRASFPDTLLGFFLGMLNGYMIVGTVWFYLQQAGYPFEFMSPPDPNLSFLAWLPPMFLNGPVLWAIFAFLAVVVLVVFV